MAQFRVPGNSRIVQSHDSTPILFSPGDGPPWGRASKTYGFGRLRFSGAYQDARAQRLP